jgi:lipopolysaccharide transport system permease protein
MGTPGRHIVRIEAASAPSWTGLRELWQRRQLVYFLAWRDVIVRYRQAVFGILWALAPPLLTMAVLSVLFGRLAKIPSDGLPYPLFSYAGLVPWSFFATAVGRASNSVIASASLVRRAYFPRAALPVSSALAPLVDALVASGGLLMMVALYGDGVSVRMAWAPAFMALALVVAIGGGLWLSALSAQYRDVRHGLPLLIQLWFFASPIAYPASLVPARWTTLYGVNPMVGVVEGFRWSMAGGPFPGAGLGLSIASACLLLFSGAWYFRRMERRLADMV